MKKIIPILISVLTINFSLLTNTCKAQNGFYNQDPVYDKVTKKLKYPGFGVQYPTTWELDDGKTAETSFILFTPLESKTDSFRENVNLVIQNINDTTVDLKKFTEVSEGQIKSMIKNSAIIESKLIKSKSGDYQKIIFKGDEGTLHLKFVQYYFLLNNQAFVLTFTAEQNKFDTYYKEAEKILDSFKLKK